MCARIAPASRPPSLQPSAVQAGDCTCRCLRRHPTASGRSPARPAVSSLWPAPNLPRRPVTRLPSHLHPSAKCAKPFPLARSASLPAISPLGPATANGAQGPACKPAGPHGPTVQRLSLLEPQRLQLSEPSTAPAASGATWPDDGMSSSSEALVSPVTPFYIMLSGEKGPARIQQMDCRQVTPSFRHLPGQVGRPASLHRGTGALD